MGQLLPASSSECALLLLLSAVFMPQTHTHTLTHCDTRSASFAFFFELAQALLHLHFTVGQQPNVFNFSASSATQLLHWLSHYFPTPHTYIHAYIHTSSLYFTSLLTWVHRRLLTFLNYSSFLFIRLGYGGAKVVLQQRCFKKIAVVSGKRHGDATKVVADRIRAALSVTQL